MKVACILSAACALCLAGIGLAGGEVETQYPRLRGTALDSRRLAPGHATEVRERRALSHRMRCSRSCLAHSRPAGAGLAVKKVVAVSGNGERGTPRPAGLHGDTRTTGPPAGEELPGLPVDESSADPADAPGEEAPSSPLTASSSSTLYWGASVGSQLTGEQAPWDMSAVTKFEEIAGKEVSLVNFFGPFANCSTTPCSFYSFPSGPMESIRAYGAIPVYSWSSQSIPSSLDEPDFQLADVIAGTYDSYIREFAEDVRDWEHPFFLRFDWEMNGSWFPWSEGVNGNQPGEFVAAWRHVHDIFTAVGADNVTWVWCPNVDPDGTLHDLAPLYPGDEYVDWTGLDGYNWGLNPAKPDRWRDFNELYAASYSRIVGGIAPDKPMLIGEMGSTENGGSKAEWIEEALAAIPADYPMIRGMLWFDTYDDGMDWPIESSSSSAGAFAQAIQSPAYVTGEEAEVAGGPIEPPN